MFTTETRDETLYVTVHADRIDASIAINFKDQMRSMINDSDGRVMLDLSAVQFIDSSGLGAIVAAMKLMPQGRKLELAGLTPTVTKVFRMTRMDTIFTIHPSSDEPSAKSA